MILPTMDKRQRHGIVVASHRAMSRRVASPICFALPLSRRTQPHAAVHEVTPSFVPNPSSATMFLRDVVGCVALRQSFFELWIHSDDAKTKTLRGVVVYHRVAAVERIPHILLLTRTTFTLLQGG
mgnify:CR=1 FL=1